MKRIPVSEIQIGWYLAYGSHSPNVFVDDVRHVNDLIEITYTYMSVKTTSRHRPTEFYNMVPFEYQIHELEIP